MKKPDKQFFPHVNTILTIQLFVGLSLLLFLFGCSATGQARSVEKIGFLEDYSILREGGEGEALFVYRNPKVNWTTYAKVIIDPVSVWLGKDSQLLDVSPEDRQRMANDLWSKLIEVLRKDYEIVHKPGPRTLRIQAALTEAEESLMVLDIVSSVVPQIRAISEAKYLVTGTAGFVGKASVEAKMTDAQTGELLMAGIDRRAGSKNVKGSFNTWNDVVEVNLYWAHQVNNRLCQLRGMTLDCVPPEKAVKK